MNRYTIGKMAKLNNVSQQTLRLYDKIGLLKPTHVDMQNGYRMYDIRQCAKLDLISYLKNLGMTLKEIKEVFDTKDISLLQIKLEEEKIRIEQQQLALVKQKSAITRTINSLELYKVAPKVGQMTLEFMNKRSMICIDEKVNIYDYEIDEYERLLRLFKEDLYRMGIDQTLYFNPGTILSKENLLQEKIHSSEFFVFMDHPIPQVTKTLEANMYLCIYCDSFVEEQKYISLLLDEIKQKGYQIIGDYLCETINDMMIFNDQERSMYLRLQIPIKIN